MSKKQKRTIYYSSPLVVVLMVLVWGKIYIGRVEANAHLLAETGQSAIKLLGEYKTGIETLDTGKILDCYDNAYAGDLEGYWVEQFQSERDGVRVYEWAHDELRPFTKADVSEQVSRYLKPVRSIEEAKCKLDSVEKINSSDSAVVRSILWVRGTRGAGEVFESHALFRYWIQARDGVWTIQKQMLIHGETVTGDRRGFTDITSKAGIDFRSHLNPVWDTPEWYPKKFQIVKYALGGVSAVDYDNDGWYDIFFADGTHPRLYHNNGDGTFSDVTERAGLPSEMIGISVGIFADFNNDGYKDLFLGCGTGPNRLFRNNGNGTFTEVTEGAGLGGYFVTVAAAADYDNDGKLDIYFGRYLDPRKDLPTTLFYTRNSQGNTLLHNEGNFHFSDVTQKAGVREGGLTLGVGWGDYDGDGYQDLYVANDFGRSVLFHNNGDGTFTDVSKETGALDYGYGMSVTWGDIDNDGNLDLYVSRVHSGQRWYGQAATLYQYLLTSTRQGTIIEDFPLYKEIYSLAGANWESYGDKVVKGNSLLLNNGDGHFKDVSEASRINPFGWFWSSAMFDYDNDGRQDIYVVDGWISGKKKDDL
jgi:hypothetical protein